VLVSFANNVSFDFEREREREGGRGREGAKFFP
jgi:hypothetical protein